MRGRVLRVLLPGLAAVVAAASGCGRQLRAVDTPDQVLLDGGRAVLKASGQVQAVVTPVKVPWQSKQQTAAFHLELTNRSDSDVTFDLTRVDLRDSVGRLRHPIPPRKLIKTFGPSEAVPMLGATVVRYRVYRRHCVRAYPGWQSYRRYARPWHLHGPRYGWRRYGLYRGWGPGSVCSVDPYYEQRQTALFLLQLLESQVVASTETVSGHIVFSHPLEKGAELVLSLPIRKTASAAATQPAESIEANAFPLNLRFEID